MRKFNETLSQLSNIEQQTFSSIFLISTRNLKALRDAIKLKTLVKITVMREICTNIIDPIHKIGDLRSLKMFPVLPLNSVIKLTTKLMIKIAMSDAFCLNSRTFCELTLVEKNAKPLHFNIANKN